MTGGIFGFCWRNVCFKVRSLPGRPGNANNRRFERFFFALLSLCMNKNIKQWMLRKMKITINIHNALFVSLSLLLSYSTVRSVYLFLLVISSRVEQREIYCFLMIPLKIAHRSFPGNRSAIFFSVFSKPVSICKLTPACSVVWNLHYDGSNWFFENITLLKEISWTQGDNTIQIKFLKNVWE